MRTHWFLPETPDVLGTLSAQADVTVRGLTAFAAWAGGAQERESDVRAAEHEADGLRRTLQAQLRRAFSTPMDQEDLYSLSELLDAVLNAAKNIVREAEVLAIEPDQPTAELAGELSEGMAHLRVAFGHLTDRSDVAIVEADAALAAERRMEKVYRGAMRDLLSIQDLRDVVARRELYRRALEAGERLAAVAERIWYATMKEN
ncbi:MAG TPA: DUF47 family protein [Microlunatus sp.]|nr:DUF47 family protein [Microlunatus sp.]